MSMTAEQLISEIQALPRLERDKLLRFVRQLEDPEIPAEFLEALDDFDHGRFVTMETAHNETPPGS
ncbi:MAG TPA: hypothetical protein VGO11_09335 [Chthoniobacteraceae bacterium]|jgi:hypothetical protein|nr:hypothetical protein [Chthoniobacteraceae bacterium]